MSFTHSFIGATPPVRYDNDPWVSVRIEESASADGPFTAFDTIALSPVDSNPSTPASRNLTTDEAVLAEGWFRLVFLDAANQASPPSNPIQSPSTGVNSLTTPSVAAVAALLRSRTYDASGGYVGTFNSNTRPSGSDVSTLITEAVTEVLGHTGGDPCNDALRTRARATAALYAAMLVELSYFPEQVGSARSPYSQLKELFDQRIQSLIRAVSDECGGQGSDDMGLGGGDSDALPSYNFDQTVAPLGKSWPAW